MCSDCRGRRAAFLVARGALVLVAAAMLAGTRAGAARGQSTLERTPNLSGGWSGSAGQAYFHFLHRFQRTGAPARKVTNSPTFLVAYAPFSSLLLGVQYATASAVARSYPNEWEAFGRLALLPESRSPLGASVQAGYNEAARSLDGALDLSRSFGRLRALASLRAFSSAYDGAAALAAGGGALLSVGPVVLAADVARLLDGRQATAWGAAVQWRLPHTPHTLSLQATNANTGTLQGASRGEGSVRFGFEFTIPITLRRYLGRDAAAVAVASEPRIPERAAPGAAGAAPTGSDTVTIVIRNLAYGQPELVITAGTVVRWVNQDPLEHTVTDAGGRFDSGLIPANGGVYRRRFDESGQYSYSCTPHPFMKGQIVVRARAEGGT